MNRLYRKGEFISLTEKLSIVQSDPSDNKFIEAALAGKATYVVSGDIHLLELKSFQGVEIISVREFLERLGI